MITRHTPGPDEGNLILAFPPLKKTLNACTPPKHDVGCDQTYGVILISRWAPAGVLAVMKVMFAIHGMVVGYLAAYPSCMTLDLPGSLGMR